MSGLAGYQGSGRKYRIGFSKTIMSGLPDGDANYFLYSKGEIMKLLPSVIAAACVLLTGPANAGRMCRDYTTPGSNSHVSQITNTADPYFGKYVFGIGVWGVGNDCDVNPAEAVTDFYIPYFTDMGIQFPLFGRMQSNLFFGTFTAYDVESDTHFNLGGSELHFVFDPTKIGSVYQYIQFIADFGGTKAPYRSDFLDPSGIISNILGDPLIPASPQAIAALNAATSVPEPTTLVLVILGLGLTLGCLVQRKHK